VLTGNATDACHQRHRHQPLPAILRQVACAYTRRQLHVVVYDYTTDKHPAVHLAGRHPRVHLNFTPTSGCWLNLVEAFFSIITRQALGGGDFPNVADLIAAIESRFIAAWNDRCRPFTWTKDPDTVIAKATNPRRRNIQMKSDTEHQI